MTINELKALGFKFQISAHRCIVTFEQKLVYGAGDFDARKVRLNESYEANVALAEKEATQFYQQLKG